MNAICLSYYFSSHLFFFCLLCLANLHLSRVILVCIAISIVLCQMLVTLAQLSFCDTSCKALSMLLSVFVPLNQYFSCTGLRFKTVQTHISYISDGMYCYIIWFFYVKTYQMMLTPISSCLFQEWNCTYSILFLPKLNIALHLVHYVCLQTCPTYSPTIIKPSKSSATISTSFSYRKWLNRCPSIFTPLRF